MAALLGLGGAHVEFAAVAQVWKVLVTGVTGFDVNVKVDDGRSMG